jgi:hypothetical protein
VSDGLFMTSRAGLHWDRRFMEAFVRPGRERENWTERNLGRPVRLRLALADADVYSLRFGP